MNTIKQLRIRVAFAAAMAGLAVLVPPHAGAQRTRGQQGTRVDTRGRIDTTFAFDKSGTVTIISLSGDIVVGTSTNSTVHVKTNDEADVRFDASPSNVTLEAGERRGSDVAFHVDVPVGVRVVARTQSGSVTIRGTRGAVEVHAQSGDVIVDDVNGGLTVHAFSGDITVSRIVGDLEVQSTNGDVKVKDLRGGADVTTVSGDVELVGATSNYLRATTVSGDIVYDGLIDASGRYQMKTNSGDVRLRVQRDASAQLSVSTWSGDVDSEFPITLKPGEHAIGMAASKKFTFDIGGGSARISAETFSGDITISANGHGANVRP